MKKEGKSDGWLLLIGSVKIFKAALLIAVGIGAMHLLHGNLGEQIEQWIHRLNVDAENPFFRTFPEKIKGMSPQRVFLLGTGAFVYSGLFMTEGIGLLMRKRWGEWFTVIITSSFLPIEIYELVREFTPFKVLLLVGNVVVAIYLIWRLKHDKKMSEQ